MPYGASCTKKNPTRHINLRQVGLDIVMRGIPILHTYFGTRYLRKDWNVHALAGSFLRHAGQSDTRRVFPLNGMCISSSGVTAESQSFQVHFFLAGSLKCLSIYFFLNSF